MEITDEIQEIKGGDSFILMLSDGICAGRFEAAENFTEIFSEFRKRFPEQRFQFLPFLLDGSAVKAYLAIKEF